MGRAPETLRFVRAPLGKPALLGETSGLEFNLSHADWCALLAVTRGRRVGVDVESIRLGRGGMEVARRFFARGEVEALAAVDAGGARGDLRAVLDAQGSLCEGAG